MTLPEKSNSEALDGLWQIIYQIDDLLGVEHLEPQTVLWRTVTQARNLLRAAADAVERLEMSR